MHPVVKEDDFLSGLSDMGALPQFSKEYNTMVSVHGWVEGTRDKGQARLRVFFPFGEHTTLTPPVLGDQTGNQAEALAVRAVLQG